MPLPKSIPFYACSSSIFNHFQASTTSIKFKMHVLRFSSDNNIYTQSQNMHNCVHYRSSIGTKTFQCNEGKFYYLPLQGVLESLPKGMNVSKVQSNEISQVYTIRTSSEIDGSVLEWLQSVATTVLLTSKASTALSLESSKCFDQILTYRFSICNCTNCSPTDYCNCCGYSAIKIQPLFATSASLSLCTGSYKAPQACSCSNGTLQVRYIIHKNCIGFIRVLYIILAINDNCNTVYLNYAMLLLNSCQFVA